MLCRECIGKGLTISKLELLVNPMPKPEPEPNKIANPVP